ncbi:MAG: NADP-dependent malic enzyme [Chloroflexi bacterium]|nr:NADP-dependent malic enzyme [Chloroflexota bacterium]
MSFQEQALDLRKRHRGVLEIRNKVVIKDELMLNALYLPPAAAEPVHAIHKDPAKVYDLTAKSNLVAVVTDGSAVLGLGNIGPEAGMPVMEGKAVLFNTFAGVEAFPIALATQDPDEIVELVRRIAPVFGAINLEDISAPRCFAIERQLKKILDIPVFHDDQHGTAVIVLAGLINALKITGKDLASVRIAVNGCGAAGIAVTNMLLSAGAKDIVVSDIGGIVFEGRRQGMNWAMEEIAKVTNRERVKGGLAEAVAGRDVFIGVSAAGVLKPEMVRSMAPDSIVFAMANPVPEIMPAEAKEAGAKVVATGRSDFENQVNNSLAFPGIFRGALDTRARDINEAMKVAAAQAIAGMVTPKELSPSYILPSGVDFHVAPKVAAAVAQAAIESGVARVKVDPKKVEESTLSWVYEGELIPVS